jgi:capsular polysaccharide biosynthesis protein
VAAHALKSRLGRGPDRVEQTLFPMICLDPSYYHWLLEFLPKLRLLELYRSKTGRTPTLVIEPDPRDFVVDTLEFAGYGPEQCLEWDQTPRAVERLITVPHREHRFNEENPSNSPYQPSKVDFEWIRKRMRSQMPRDMIDPSANRRIYISRQYADRGRKVLNNDELSSLLKEKGFEFHVLEDYPFRKQMRLFIEADVIAGPHGAGLANMLFADNPLVIEFFPEKFIKPHFYFLASIMGFEYESVVTDAVDNNLRVDIDCLRRCLDNVGL